jgi:hypothetical protein
MRTGEPEERSTVTCATCKHSQYLKLNLHTCSNFDTPNAVDGDHHCPDWEPLFVPVGRGMARFGALCGCERCRV